MKIRFQADADLNQVIVQAVLRQTPEIDFKTAVQAELEGVDDLEVLALAAKESRVLVSHDKKTMPHHFANFTRHHESSGVIIIPQSLAISKAMEELILIWSATEAEEWKNRIGFLPI